MHKFSKIAVTTAMTVLLMGGAVPTTASASSVVPKAMRGTWYAYGDGSYFLKEKYGKKSSMHIRKAKHGWYTVMAKNTSTEGYRRVITQNVAGKKRRVMLMASYWDATYQWKDARSEKWFHNKLHHSYVAKLKNYAKPF